MLLPLGSYLAVLQPYMRHTRDDPVSGRLILRCDNPQVRAVLPPVPPHLPHLSSRYTRNSRFYHPTSYTYCKSIAVQALA